jgi:hypothetical protein
MNSKPGWHWQESVNVAPVLDTPTALAPQEMQAKLPVPFLYVSTGHGSQFVPAAAIWNPGAQEHPVAKIEAEGDTPTAPAPQGVQSVLPWPLKELAGQTAQDEVVGVSRPKPALHTHADRKSTPEAFCPNAPRPHDAHGTFPITPLKLLVVQALHTAVVWFSGSKPI